MKQLALLVTLTLGASAAHATEVLTLEKYLEQVKSQNQAARAAVESIASNEELRRQPELGLVPELYATYAKFDDKTPPAAAAMGDETRGETWRAGLRKQTDFGLGADLYFTSQRVIVSNASPFFLNVPDYNASRAEVDLTQSLWRNGFGESTRAQLEADRAANQAALLQAKFSLKNLLLSAENLYWSVVMYNEIVKLQQENVERARKLRDYMSQRAKMKLFDDTDALQTLANFEKRELDLQQSLDMRAQLIRQLNSVRGMESDTVESMDTLPSHSMMEEVSKAVASAHMTREDFDMLRAQAREGVARAKVGRSQVQPQLDIVGGFATNGRDGTTGGSFYQSGTDRYPMWKIGLNFSIPLDFGLIGDLRRGLSRASNASEQMNAKAAFDEARLWDDLTQQKREAQGRYERAQRLEKIQAELIKREKTRLLNGRATTFEALTMEQSMAEAQIGRARAQIDLLSVHNAIKTFEASK